MLTKAEIKLVKSLEHKKFRDKEGLFVAEGPKVISDLRQTFELVRLYTDSDEVHRLSFQKTPQSPLAIFKIPDYKQQTTDFFNESLPSGKHRQGLILALDKIQDPGNLGTIIRIADWFGIENLLCSHDTVDVFNPKVVQATMGSLARVKIHYCNLVETLTDTNIPICGTVLDGDNIYQQQLPESAIIVMGNEGNGISDEVKRILTHRLLIPAARKGAESLNVAVATAITLSEFTRPQFKT